MTKEFKPLTEIVEDPEVEKGDLILVKRSLSPVGMDEVIWTSITSIFYSGPDMYVADGKNDSFEKGREILGIRVFNAIGPNGEYRFNGPKLGVFHDKLKGLLIPFDHDSKYEYCLVEKKENFPK